MNALPPSISHFSAIINAALLSTLLIGRVEAAALLDEPFDYLPGSSLAGQTNPFNLQTWDLVTPVSGSNLAPPTIGNTSLSDPNLPPSTGNSALTDRTQVGAARIELTLLQNSGTVFYSALVRVNDISGLTNTTTGSFFAGLNSGTGTGTAISAGGAALLIHLDPDNASAYNLGIGVGVNQNPDRVFAGNELAQGDTVLIVASYTFNPGTDDDVASLWINPDPSTFGTNSPPLPTVTSAGSLSAANSDSASLASFFLRNNSVEPAQIQVDEVRVDNSWAAVTVPEPSSFALFALAGGWLLARRRR